VNHDDRWTTVRAWLHVCVEREIAGIADISTDTRNDVIAVGITGVKRRAGLCECGGVDRERDEERNDLSCDESHGRAPRVSVDTAQRGDFLRYA
jgi:hypothetical protein